MCSCLQSSHLPPYANDHALPFGVRSIGCTAIFQENLNDELDVKENDQKVIH